MLFSPLAWSMESSLMVRCLLTRPLEVEMIPSTPSFLRLEQASMYQELSSLILNQLSWMRFALEPTVSCFTLSSWSLERRMLLTTMQEDITPLVSHSIFLNGTFKIDVRQRRGRGLSFSEKSAKSISVWWGGGVIKNPNCVLLFVKDPKLEYKLH